MVTYSAAQLAETKNLVTFEEMMTELSASENLTRRAISTDGTDLVRFDFADDFAEKFDDLSATDLLVGAEVRVDGTAYQLTKGSFTRALQQVGLRPTYGKKTPGKMLAEHVNYHFSHRGTKSDMVTLLSNDHILLEMVPDSRTVFSTFQVVDTVARAAAEHFGTRVDNLFFDYKYQNKLDRSAVRLIVPDTQKTIKAMRHGSTQEDIWSTGIAVHNSMTGEVDTPLSVSGYLFAWWCTNGSTTTRAHGETFTKRAVGTEWEDVSDWLEASTFSTLEVLPEELDKVEELTRMNLAGELGSTAQQVLRSFDLPASEMDAVRDFLIEGDDLSGYGLMQAITQAANDPDLPDAKVARILDAGGAVAHSLVDRCGTCHQVRW